MYLINWTYTTEEWKAYCRWAMRKKGWLPYLFHRLFATRKTIPEIRITSEKVHFGDRHHSFEGADRSLRKIDIKDVEGIHFIQISYRENIRGNSAIGEITIPIPKGKLREAIEVQSRLTLR